MRRWSFFLILSVFCSLCYQANSSQLKLSSSYFSSRLQQHTVSAIYRDTEHLLWIATQQGLYQFDGSRLTLFNSDKNNKNWIPESEVVDIVEDSLGDIFIATAPGNLLKWDRDSEEITNVLDYKSPIDNKLAAISASKNGGIWLLHRNGLTLYNERFQNTVHWIESRDSTNSLGRFHDILEDNSGNVWVGGSRGLIKLEVDTKSRTHFSLESLGLPVESEITALKVNSNGDLIIGSNSGHIFVWDIGLNKRTVSANLAESMSSYVSEFALLEDTLIIGTDRGLYASDESLSTITNVSVGLSNTNVYSLFQDRKHVWVGTIGGLDLLSFAEIELFNSKNSEVPHDVLAFEEDRKGRVWIGTYSGLYLYDENTSTHIKFSSGIKIPPIEGNQITTIAAQDNKLWLGLLHGGVYILDSVSGTYMRPRLSDKNVTSITKIVASKDGKSFWVASYNQGLFLVTEEESKSYLDTRALPENSVTVLFQSEADVFLAISGNKIYKYNPSGDRFDLIDFQFPFTDQSPDVYSLAGTKNGDILIGTKDYGLFFWSRNNQISNQFYLKKAKQDSSLNHSTIYGIQPDTEGNLWCSTQNGIVKLDENGALIKRFTVADGLQGNDFAFGASFASREGLIYFGGVNGYNRFDPSKVKFDNTPSPMRLTGINFSAGESRNLGPVADLQSVQLTHKDESVAFEFSVLDFINPEGNQYRYKLEKYDPQWIDNGNHNIATYSHLPPGNYVLRVQGANSSGIWNLEGLSLNISVLPAPWRSLWAFIGYGIALAFLVWCLHRIYRGYAIEKISIARAKEMFEAENQAHDEMQEQLELQDELIHSAYAHNLATLSLVGDGINIQGNDKSDTSSSEIAASSAKRILALSILEDYLYYEDGGPVVNLKKYTDAILSELLENATIDPETVITINEVPPRLIPTSLASPISIILYELIENCIQHAFAPESPANYIHITMGLSEPDEDSQRSIQLTIQDNGVGISGDAHQRETQYSGFSVVRAIVSKLGGDIAFSGDQGTTVAVTIPDQADVEVSESEPPDI